MRNSIAFSSGGDRTTLLKGRAPADPERRARGKHPQTHGEARAEPRGADVESGRGS